MFEKLTDINTRPKVFGHYTAEALWADEYRSQQMLAFHLNDALDLSSRNKGFIDKSAAWIIDHFQLAPGKSVCDLGCGPGLYTTRFARAGADVTGLDFSRNSIAYAAGQAEKTEQRIDYIHANYLEYLPQQEFDLVTLIMCDYCALSPVQRKTLLAKVRDCLKQEGAVLLDVYSMSAYEAREEGSIYEKNQLDHFWCQEDYFCFVNTVKYDQEAVVLDKYTIFPESGGCETVYNWLQYFSPESLEKELSEAGLSTTLILKDVSGEPFDEQHTEFAIVAGKK